MIPLRPYGGPLGSLEWPLIKDPGERGKCPGLRVELLSSASSQHAMGLSGGRMASLHCHCQLHAADYVILKLGQVRRGGAEPRCETHLFIIMLLLLLAVDLM